MKESFNILIIEDHQIIINTIKKAVNNLKQNYENIAFNIIEVKNCKNALSELKKTNEESHFNLVFLDIKLPASLDDNLFSGEDLGLEIRQHNSDTKIIVCTSLANNLRLSSIVKSINPEGFLIKSDIDFIDMVNSIEKVLINDGIYYSETITNLLKQQITSTIFLDKLDLKILKEIANSASIKELTELVPLSRAGIEKRIKKLREKFNVNTYSNRDLIIEVKKKGFI